MFSLAESLGVMRGTLAPDRQSGPGKRLRRNKSRSARCDRISGSRQQPRNAIWNKLLEIDGLSVQNELLAACQLRREEPASHRSDANQNGRRASERRNEL